MLAWLHFFQNVLKENVYLPFPASRGCPQFSICGFLPSSKLTMAGQIFFTSHHPTPTLLHCDYLQPMKITQNNPPILKSVDQLPDFHLLFQFLLHWDLTYLDSRNENMTSLMDHFVDLEVAHKWWVLYTCLKLSILRR